VSWVLEREEVDRKAFDGDYGEWDVTVWSSQRSSPNSISGGPNLPHRPANP
jgi:hypothetical protein